MSAQGISSFPQQVDIPRFRPDPRKSVKVVVDRRSDQRLVVAGKLLAKEATHQIQVRGLAIDVEVTVGEDAVATKPVAVRCHVGPSVCRELGYEEIALEVKSNLRMVVEHQSQQTAA
jgi:hypothetical protein